MSTSTTLRRAAESVNGYIVGVIALIILHREQRENEAQYPRLTRREDASDDGNLS